MQEATLQKATKTKQANGTHTEELNNVGNYVVQPQELTDEISASIYGANVYKMLRIRSVNKDLENFLYDKATNKVDNISSYYVSLNNRKYKVKAVNQSGVDLELV